MKALMIGALLGILAVTATAQPVPVAPGQFTMAADPENALLPPSIQWKRQGAPVELLHEKTGLNLSFTSFEFRNKFYREENKFIWAGQADPRFVTDVGPHDAQMLAEDGLSGLRVTYANSFAQVDRRVMFHDTEPRVRIEYRLEATRDIVVHEAEMFGVTVGLAPAFTVLTVCDVRAPERPLLSASAAKAQRQYELSFLNAGPALFGAPELKAYMLASGIVAGEVPTPMTANLLRFKAGQKFSFTIDLQCFADEQAAGKALADAGAKISDEQIPYALTRVANLLLEQNKPAEAEAALLKAADLNKTYATPFSRLAAMRRDLKDEGTISQTEAWVEAAYRQPYNYGYILSGSGFFATKGLTEEQKRLAIFNVLIAVENTQFYADYYAWGARPFENMKMYAQACAMYRQALWAVDHLPRSEAHKVRVRAQFEKKIAELEKKLVGQTYVDMPEMIPIRTEE